jgi:hypothetical protein
MPLQDLIVHKINVNTFKTITSLTNRAPNWQLERLEYMLNHKRPTSLHEKMEKAA